MRVCVLLLALAMWALPLQAALAEPPTIEAFQERCESKEDVYSAVDGELIQLGERIHGYCVGFLEGVLAALEHEERVCPDWEKVTTDYLVSVVNYSLEDKLSEDLDVIVVVTQAFKRAFPCDNESEKP